MRLAGVKRVCMRGGLCKYIYRYKYDYWMVCCGLGGNTASWALGGVKGPTSRPPKHICAIHIYTYNYNTCIYYNINIIIIIITV